MNRDKVFLGGTCAGSTWRDELIPMLNIEYFNPVVDVWKPEDQIIERKERQDCEFSLYVITPNMKGYLSLAEVADDSNKKLYGRTILCVLKEYDNKSFTDFQFKSLYNDIGDLIKINNGVVFDNLKDVADYLNNFNLNSENIDIFE